MKKTVMVFAFLSLFSCAKSMSQINSLKLISESSQINLPYGDKNVLHKFPADWTHSKEKAAEDSLYNNLSFYLFQDIENPLRTKIRVDYSEVKSLLEKEFIPSEAVKNNSENLEIRSIKIFNSKDFEAYSITYQGKIDCKLCEFPESQSQNILVTIKNGKIIEKLPISYFNGSDLSQSTRYFYIDQNSIIHIKDFKSDEEGVTFSKYLKYKISSQGKFIKQ
jgi:hypothetical protein